MKEESFNNNLFGTISGFGREEHYLSAYINDSYKIIFLVGDGGIGKTTHLRKFLSDMSTNLNVATVYISLYDKSPNMSIGQIIIRRFPTINGRTLTEGDLYSVLSSINEKLYIVLDGLNEYLGDLNALFDDINEMSKYNQVFFIISSRFSIFAHNIPYDKVKNISELRVNHLKEAQVCKSLNIDYFPITWNDKSKDLITTPFYIKICLEANIRIDYAESINASFLMYKYLEYNINRYTNHNNKFILENIFPYICYRRYLSETIYEISNVNTQKSIFTSLTIEEAIEYYKQFYNYCVSFNEVESLLINCNFIEKDDKMGIITYRFRHQNIRDTYAALHVAETLIIISQRITVPKYYGYEINLYAELNDFLKEISNSINILCKNNDLSINILNDSDSPIVIQYLFKNSKKDEEAMLFAKKLVEIYEDTDDFKIREPLSQIYILALCMIAKNYRLLKCKHEVNDLVSFQKCLSYSEKAKQVYDKNNDYNSDGYNHIGKSLNSFMEYILNNNHPILLNTEYLLIKRALSEIEYADNILRYLKKIDSKITRALYLVLKPAHDAYHYYEKENTIHHDVLWILALNYVSRAYMSDACIKSSAESLNLMGMIIENDYNIRLKEIIYEKWRINITQLKSFGEERLENSFILYDSASKQPHVVRGYSALKKAILLITNKVNYPIENKLNEINNDLTYAHSAHLNMTYYWKGRWYSDMLNQPIEAEQCYNLEKIRIKKLLDNDNKPYSNNSLILCVNIELLQFYRVSSDMSIILELWDTVSAITYDNLECKILEKIQYNDKFGLIVKNILVGLIAQKTNLHNMISADKYWITRLTVETNISRFKSNYEKLINNMTEDTNNE